MLLGPGERRTARGFGSQEAERQGNRRRVAPPGAEKENQGFLRVFERAQRLRAAAIGIGGKDMPDLAGTFGVVPVGNIEEVNLAA